MYKLFYPLSISALIIGLIACDKVDEPIAAPAVDPFDSNLVYPFIDSTAINDSVRIVLVEEFTGHECSFCPGNTKQLLTLSDDNKNKMVIVSIHAGSTFAEPNPPKYPTDFRTEFGTTVHDQYQVNTFGYPSALVSRLKVDGTSIFLGHPGWKPVIEDNLNQSTVLALGLAASYIEEENQIAIRVSANAVENITGDYRLILLALEDSVIAPQKDVQSTEPDERVVDYPHRHVLRAKVNGGNQFGESFISGNIASGEWIESLSLSELPENVVNVENVSVVAIVIDELNEEVLQATEVHLEMDTP